MISYDECVAEIQALLAQSHAGGSIVPPESDLIDELGLASLDVMELIEALEDRFDVAFPLNELGDVRTISDLAQRIQNLT